MTRGHQIMSDSQRCKCCGAVCYIAALNDAGICLECVIAKDES